MRRSLRLLMLRLMLRMGRVIVWHVVADNKSS